MQTNNVMYMAEFTNNKIIRKRIYCDHRKDKNKIRGSSISVH